MPIPKATTAAGHCIIPLGWSSIIGASYEFQAANPGYYASATLPNVSASHSYVYGPWQQYSASRMRYAIMTYIAALASSIFLLTLQNGWNAFSVTQLTKQTKPVYDWVAVVSQSAFNYRRRKLDCVLMSTETYAYLSGDYEGTITRLEGEHKQREGIIQASDSTCARNQEEQ